MDNVPKRNIYTNLLRSQTFRSYCWTRLLSRRPRGGVYTSPHMIDYRHTDALLLTALFLVLVIKAADHTGHMVKVVKCLPPPMHLDHGLESHSRYGCLSLCVLLLCSCSSLETGWSPAQRILQAVYKIHGSRLILMWKMTREPNTKWRRRTSILKTGVKLIADILCNTVYSCKIKDYGKYNINSACRNTTVGFEIISLVDMKSSVFWDMTPNCPMKISLGFGWTNILHLQGRRGSQGKN
jgi:hypothetical protein